MKKKIIFSFFSIVAGMLLVNCGGSGSNNSDAIFLNATKNTLPVLSANTAVSSNSITWGVMSDEIKAVFMDPAEDTTLGVNNIYHLLNDLDSATSTVRKTTCSKTIIAGINTVPFFNTDVNSSGFFATNFDMTYTCYDTLGWQSTDTKNTNTSYTVGKVVGNKQHTMYSLSAECSNSTTCKGSSIYQGIYDETTKDLQIRLVAYMDPFSMRSEFYGNAGTHTFTLRLTKANPPLGDSGYWIEMRGYGVSQGTGYFLIKASDHVGLLNQYYCYDAATKSASNVTDTITTSNCKDYKTIVDALTPIDHASEVALEPFAATLSTY
ncbi:MAG: hypothetical protein NTY22_02495 [Proteobacteria bacterium]|nr:hypothetical protein [Pseudomonadota bacterium]